LETFNRFFGVVIGSKPEIFLVRYDKKGRMVQIVERYSKEALFIAFAPITHFLKFWFLNQKRRQYQRYAFDPAMTCPSNEFNLFTGWKVEIENNLEDHSLNMSHVDPFLHHVRKYFCRENEEHFRYFINWFAYIIQNPGKKTGVVIVLKSEKQGAGKGCVIDQLFGNGIFGDQSYAQVGNMEGLIGKFNSNLMNKQLVNVDEVMMCKKEANEVKNMVTDPYMYYEKKGLDKIRLKNLMNFVFTSNKDHCVNLDMSDRRYFILDVDDSNANDQKYYRSKNGFGPYCENPLTAIHVYLYLK
jgi:hypothetical protein